MNNKMIFISYLAVFEYRVLPVENMTKIIGINSNSTELNVQP
jgi:hypothetical protein